MFVCWDLRETSPFLSWEGKNTSRVGECVIAAMSEGHVSDPKLMQHP